MNHNEWPLVVFTLLSQISMGILLAGLVVFIFAKNGDLAGSIELKRVVMLVAMLSMGVALFLSFAHLARPSHSVFALGNLAGSHLSREILMVSVFAVSLFVIWILLKFNLISPGAFGYLYLAALFAGLVLVWTMAKIYMIPTIPAWNTPLTLLKFYNSGLLIGSGVLMLMLIYFFDKGIPINRLDSAIRIVFILIAIGTFFHVLTTFITPGAPENLTIGFPTPTIHGLIKVTRSVLLLLGFVLMLWWFRSFNVSVGQVNHLPAYIGFLLLLLAEITGRYIFYASYYRVGV
jgi:anaerobic dimethyl sulfoxide reductase subunit C